MYSYASNRKFDGTEENREGFSQSQRGGRKMCRGGERRFLYLSVVGEGVGYIDKLKINSTFLKIKSFRGG